MGVTPGSMYFSKRAPGLLDVLLNPKVFNSIITANRGLTNSNYGLGRELGAENL
ncbi:hypothetical protein Scep_022319 [Stephania cephalantha]|uniref:Uncharacterized protein n=1 Tax=Stephania cephalantha TaxID=152367 RepID=A0AAP0F556_9MAGN